MTRSTFLGLVVGGAGGAITVVVWWPGFGAVAAIAAFVVGYAVSMPSLSEWHVSPALAVAVAVALITLDSPVLLIGGAAAAIPLGWIAVRIVHGSRSAADLFPAEALGVTAFAVAFTAIIGLVPNPVARSVALGIAAACAAFGFLCIVAVRALLWQERRRESRRLATIKALGDWPAYASVVSAGALLAITLEPMDGWSIPLAGLPYLFAHVSLRRLGDTRRTYEQTIRALGAIPEAAGQVAVGHSGRTAQLAVAAGVEFGLGGRELRRLEHAALLHDVGRLVLANPAVTRGGYSFADVAGWSAAIIGEARFLEPVADIVALQHSPYRQEGQVRDPLVSRASQLVRIAARYDSATSEGMSSLEAVEILHRGAGYDYDPELVMALRQVLVRTGELVG